MENRESTNEKEKSKKNKTFVTYLELRVLWIPGKEKKTRSTSSREALYHYDAIYQRVLIFACSMSHIRPYLFSSPEAEDDVTDIGKHDFPSVLLQPKLSNANLAGRASQQPRCRMITVAYLFVIMPNATIVVKIYLTLIFRGISQKESAHHL